MYSVRAIAILFSLLAHGAGAWALVSYSSQRSAFDSGVEKSRVVFERAMIIENVRLIGNAPKNVKQSTAKKPNDLGRENAAKIVKPVNSKPQKIAVQKVDRAEPRTSRL